MQIVFSNYSIDGLLEKSQFGSPFFCSRPTIVPKFIEPKTVQPILKKENYAQVFQLETWYGQESSIQFEIWITVLQILSLQLLHLLWRNSQKKKNK